MQNLQDRLVDNFMRYLAVSSQSNPEIMTLPSTEGQMTLAQMLRDELAEMGYTTQLFDTAILIAHIPATHPQAKAIGFVAHLDTVDVGLSPDVKPQKLRYRGEKLCLNAEQKIYIDETSHPELGSYLNQDIIFSDGTSVLGADNKAAIAVLMTLAKQLLDSDTPHGDIYLAFVPDEEVGLRGAKAISQEDFPVDYCYTIDCCERGEVVYETFNAGSATLSVAGVTAHPMSAKNILVNPNLIAADFVQLLRDHGRPEQTEGREGYFWVSGLKGNQNIAEVSVLIRDFDQDSYHQRKDYLQSVL